MLEMIFASLGKEWKLGPSTNSFAIFQQSAGPNPDVSSKISIFGQQCKKMNRWSAWNAIMIDMISIKVENFLRLFIFSPKYSLAAKWWNVNDFPNQRHKITIRDFIMSYGVRYYWRGCTASERQMKHLVWVLKLPPNEIHRTSYGHEHSKNVL